MAYPDLRSFNFPTPSFVWSWHMRFGLSLSQKFLFFRKKKWFFIIDLIKNRRIENRISMMNVSRAESFIHQTWWCSKMGRFIRNYPARVFLYRVTFKNGTGTNIVSIRSLQLCGREWSKNYVLQKIVMNAGYNLLKQGSFLNIMRYGL